MNEKFIEKIKSKTDLELNEYVENKNSYQKEAVLTAILEIEARGNSNTQIESLKNEVQSEIELEKKHKIQDQESSKIPDDLPLSIGKAAKMVYLSIVLGIINPIIVDLTTEVENFANPINLTIILFSTVILAFLGYQINLGKKWARDIFTVLTVLGFLAFPIVILDTFRLNPLVGVLSLAQAVLQVFAIVLLYKSDSRNWYSKNKNE